MHRREKIVITQGGGIVTLPEYIDYISLYDALTDDCGVGNDRFRCGSASRMSNVQHKHFISPKPKTTKSAQNDEEWEVIECDVKSKIIQCSEVLSSCQSQSSHSTGSTRTHNSSTSSNMSDSTDTCGQPAPPEFYKKCAFYDYEVVDMRASSMK